MKRGDRVRLTTARMFNAPHLPPVGTEGTVLGAGFRPGTVAVRWDTGFAHDNIDPGERLEHA